jgi:hypothetical protein
MRRMIAFSIIPFVYLVTRPISEVVFTPLLLESGLLVDLLGLIFWC